MQLDGTVCTAANTGQLEQLGFLLTLALLHDLSKCKRHTFKGSTIQKNKKPQVPFHTHCLLQAYWRSKPLKCKLISFIQFNDQFHVFSYRTNKQKMRIYISSKSNNDLRETTNEKKKNEMPLRAERQQTDTKNTHKEQEKKAPAKPKCHRRANWMKVQWSKSVAFHTCKSRIVTHRFRVMLAFTLSLSLPVQPASSHFNEPKNFQLLDCCFPVKSIVWTSAQTTHHKREIIW